MVDYSGMLDGRNPLTIAFTIFIITACKKRISLLYCIKRIIHYKEKCHEFFVKENFEFKPCELSIFHIKLPMTIHTNIFVIVWSRIVEK